MFAGRFVATRTRGLVSVVYFDLYYQKKIFIDEHSDVTIKCEALDGAHFYPDMYGRTEMDTSDIIITKV
jgi:hypothetical protein